MTVTMDYWALINSAALVLVASVLSFAATRHFYNRTAATKEVDRLAANNVERDAKIVELQKQLALVGASVVPISTAFQAILIKELTHFHTPDMDVLMTKVGPPSTLTEEEEDRLARLLRQREVDMCDQITESERDAARMLPMVMKRARAEATAPMAENAVLQSVVLPEPPAKQKAEAAGEAPAK